MHGMYRYAPEASTFQECRTGVRFPVSPEASNFVLESTYLRFFPAGSSSTGVLTAINGRVLPRAPLQGGPPRNAVVVDTFISLGGDSCAQAPTVR
jgi:uncharacterized lipoprotein NlpE involved in copper resistance